MSYTKLRLQTKRTTALFIIKLKTKLPNQIIVTHGCQYLFMAAIGCQCLLMAAISCQCLLMAAIGCQCLHIAANGCQRLLRAAIGCHLIILLIILYNMTYYYVTSILYFIN